MNNGFSRWAVYKDRYTHSCGNCLFLLRLMPVFLNDRHISPVSESVSSVSFLSYI